MLWWSVATSGIYEIGTFIIENSDGPRSLNEIFGDALAQKTRDEALKILEQEVPELFFLKMG